MTSDTREPGPAAGSQPCPGMRVYRAEPTEAFDEKLVLWKDAGGLAALDLGGYETRNESVLSLVAQADAAHGLPEFAPTLVHTGDQPLNAGDPTWRSLAFCAADGYLDVPVPDFLFDAWPQTGIGDYEETAAALAAAAAAAPARRLVGWIGNCDTHPTRRLLLGLAREHPELLDVHDITWVPPARGCRLETAANNYLTLVEQVERWAVLLDVEGRGWSARLKLLLHSGRPVLVQERPWREWFWAAFEPWTHFVPVARDLSDLAEKACWALAHPEEADRIGAAARAAARRHASRGAALRRWADVLDEVAESPDCDYAPAAARAVLDPVLAGLTRRSPAARTERAA